VSRIAVLAAGEIAERLVTAKENHSAGKSNDMERATQLAQDAVLRYGLSEDWGTKSVPENMSLDTYIAGLSEKQRQVLEQEVEKFIKEGQALARQLLEANFANALIPLGNLLAEKGIVKADEMAKFYAGVTLKNDAPKAEAKKSVLAGAMAWLRSGSKAPAVTPESKSLLRPDIQTPEKVADIDAIVRERKLKQFQSVPLPDKVPVGTNSAYDHWKKSFAGNCEALLTKKK
jgi:hypothetical protein